MVPLTANDVQFPLLTVLLVLPAAAGIICLSLDDARQARLLGAAAVGVELVLAAVQLAVFEIRPGGSIGWTFQFSYQHDWIPGLGISYWVGVDGISVFLVTLTALIMAVAVLAANFMIADRVRTFVGFMLILETAVLGVFMSLNLFLFFVFWEAMLIPSYFLLGIWGEERRVYATTKFVIYTIFGSFLMLVAIFYLWTYSASPGHPATLDMAGPDGLLARLTSHPLSTSTQSWLFLAFGLAFAIKLPLFPFHTWAPDAYAESPVPFVIALSGILSKAGAFGFLRYCLPLFPAASHNLQGLVSVLAIIGMLYAAGLALVQTDIKRLVAYSSVSHMNLIALGIFSLNATGLDGSVLQMINHSMIISGLFLAVAYIAARTGSRTLTDMGGLGRRWPILMWLFFVFVLAGLDLPGLSSFAGEFLILAGVFRENAWFSSIGAVTVILAAWYMIRFFQDSMNGPLTAAPEQTAETAENPERTAYQFPVVRRLVSADLLPREMLLWVPLVLLIVYIGVQPDGLTARMNPTTNSVAGAVRTLGSLGGGR